jgi:hypothetical protein
MPKSPYESDQSLHGHAHRSQDNESIQEIMEKMRNFSSSPTFKPRPNGVVERRPTVKNVPIPVGKTEDFKALGKDSSTHEAPPDAVKKDIKKDPNNVGVYKLDQSAGTDGQREIFGGKTRAERVVQLLLGAKNDARDNDKV